MEGRWPGGWSFQFGAGGPHQGGKFEPSRVPRDWDRARNQAYIVAIHTVMVRIRYIRIISVWHEFVHQHVGLMPNTCDRGGQQSWVSDPADRRTFLARVDRARKKVKSQLRKAGEVKSLPRIASCKFAYNLLCSVGPKVRRDQLTDWDEEKEN